MIGSDIPALSELVRDRANGRLYASGDVHALAGILRDLAANPGLVNQWRASLPDVRTMDDVTSDYLAMYTE